MKIEFERNELKEIVAQHIFNTMKIMAYPEQMTIEAYGVVRWDSTIEIIKPEPEEKDES